MNGSDGVVLGESERRVLVAFFLLSYTAAAAAAGWMDVIR
jgi:hypothetical protein